MAEIVNTLFGVTPESYRQAQQQQADAQALQYAKLDPFQQANYAIGRGANMLGGAIGGALGGQDPELQRITMRQQIAGQLDYNNDESMKQGIVALNNAGDPAGAMQLQQILLSQQAKKAAIGKDEAAAQASKAQANREAKQAIPTDIQVAQEIAVLQEQIGQLKDLPAGSERDAALRLASGKLAELQRLTTKTGEKPLTPKIQEVGTAVGSGKAVYTYQTADGVQQITFETGPDGKQIMMPYNGAVDRTISKTDVKTSNTNVQESEFAKKRGALQATSLTEASTMAQSGAQALATIKSMKELDSQGQLFTGPLAGGYVVATNLLASLGLLSPTQTNRLTSSEIYDKQAKDLVMQDLGGKLGAQISDADRKFVEARIPQITTSVKARTELLDKLAEIQRGKISYYTKMNEHANKFGNLNTFDFAQPYAPPKSGWSITPAK